MDGAAWRATAQGVVKSRTRLSDFTFTYTLFEFPLFVSTIPFLSQDPIRIPHYIQSSRLIKLLQTVTVCQAFLVFMTLTVLRIAGQVFGMSLFWVFPLFFFSPMDVVWLYVLRRKLTKVKCPYHIISRTHAINMTSQRMFVLDQLCWHVSDFTSVKFLLHALPHPSILYSAKKSQ